MQIRTLPPHLTDAAVRLWQECGQTRPWNEPVADLERALGGSSSTVLGALDGDVLVGTVMVGHDGHRGWVYYLAVDPGHRGTGIARELMAQAETWVAARGIPKVQLMVRADNEDVLAFYDRLGYADQSVVVLGRFLDTDLQRLRG